MIDYYMTQLKSRSYLLRPSVFWETALLDIADTHTKNGYEEFRNNSLNLSFFVPTYGTPGNSFEANEIKNFLKTTSVGLSDKQISYVEKSFNGYFHALSDYRIFLASNSATDKVDLLKFSESNIGNPLEQFNFGNQYFSRSSLNYLLGLSFLKRSFPNFVPKTILEIGGGFGTLGEIIGKSNINGFTYINLDLPPIFLIAEYYLKECFIDQQLSFFDHYQHSNGVIKISSLPRFTLLPNWRIQDIEGKIDLFVNFISFQEMEPDIVLNYITRIQALKPELVLLRNIREGKQVLAGDDIGVKEPIKTKNYLEYFSQYELVQSNVIPFGFYTVDGYNSELLLLKRK